MDLLSLALHTQGRREGAKMGPVSPPGFSFISRRCWEWGSGQAAALQPGKNSDLVSSLYFCSFGLSDDVQNESGHLQAQRNVMFNPGWSCLT